MRSKVIEIFYDESCGEGHYVVKRGDGMRVFTIFHVHSCFACGESALVPGRCETACPSTDDDYLCLDCAKAAGVAL